MSSISNLETFLDDIAFKHGEEVIIRSAEVKGLITGIKFNTTDNTLYYLVQFTYGSVFLVHDPSSDIGDYDCDEGWFPEKYLRKIK